MDFEERFRLEIFPPLTLQEIGNRFRAFVPVGSRVTCKPAPTDTDIDYLCLADRYFDIHWAMKDGGWKLGGSQPTSDLKPIHPNETFMSYTKDDVNLIITHSVVFFRKFMEATNECTRLNLLVKADRIKLFQRILYGNIIE